jgi:hypothetical protein
MLAGTLGSGAVAAQLAGRKPPPLDSEANRSRELDRLTPDHRPPNRENRAAAKRRELFRKRLSDFAKAWNALMQSSAKGGWNARQAKAVRIAFDRLVHSDGWAEMAATDHTDPPGSPNNGL